MADDARVGTATVLFTDLVGSTELRSRIGEDAAETLRGRHDGLVVGAIEANGGRVVKSLGDGVMATFEASADAVAAGVAVQQAIHRHNGRGGDERLAVRVGISVGDVTFEGGDCFGLPVVEAQRLEAAAEPGTVVCADVVALLARGRGGHEFRSLGALELKGLAQPVPASEVVWRPAADEGASSQELPSVLATAVGMPFAGRAEPLAALNEAWKGVVAGGFAVVLLAGEPGIGKTRLAAELAITAVEQGAAVLAGRSDEDLDVAFQPFAAALRTFVSSLPGDDLAGRLGPGAAELVRMWPELADRVPGLGEPVRADPESERFALFEAVADWLGAAGGDGPSLLVLDDLHWADAGSLLVLRRIIERAPAGALVVGTYRDTDVGRGHALSGVLADLRRMPAVTRVAVGGMDADEVRELVELIGGNELDEAGESFAQLVADESAGNPFFVGELLRHLVETGVLVQRDGRWTSDVTLDRVGIPEGIREVVGRRLSRLGDDTDDVLRAGAVIGYEFDLALLALVLRRSDDETLDALEAAIAAGLVIEVGVDRFRFAHALVRQTLHEELTSSRRARQHRRVAEALELLQEGRTDEVLPQLALHWAEAVAGGDPSVAIDYAVRAGDQADGRLAYEEAAAHYLGALDLLDGADGDEAAEGRILARLAGAQQRAGDNDYAATVRRAARVALDAGDVATAVEALTLTIRVSVTVGTYPDPEKVELLDRALRALGDDDVAPRAQLLGQLGLELLITGEIDRRSAVLDELETLLPSVPDPRLRARVARGTGLERVGVAYDREFILERQRWIRDGFVHESNPFELAALHSMDFFLSNGLGDRAGADAALAFLVQHREGSAFHSMYACVLENMAAMIDGRLDDAERATKAWEVLALRLDSPNLAHYQVVQAFTLRREQGGVAEIADLFLGYLGDDARSTAVGALCGYALIAAGRPAGAEALLVDFEPSRIPEDAAWPIAMALWAEVVAGLGSSDTCAELLRLLESNRGDHFLTGGMYCGAVSRVVALLEDRRGDHAAADAAFAAAVEDHTRLQSPPWIARTHLDWAESLLARGETERAAAQLDAAEAALGDLDLPESRARLAALRSAG